MSFVSCPELTRLGIRLALALGQLPNNPTARDGSSIGDARVLRAQQLLYSHQQNCPQCNGRRVEDDGDDVATAS